MFEGHTTTSNNPDDMPTLDEMLETIKRIKAKFPKLPKEITLCVGHFQMVHHEFMKHPGIEYTKQIPPWSSIRFRYKKVNENCYLCESERADDAS